MKRKYILAHGADVDGIVSHSIAERAGFDKHIYSDYPTLIQDLEQLADRPNGEVIIADIAPTGNMDLLEQKVIRVAESHDLKAWIDHHNWDRAQSLLPHIEEVVFDRENSSGRLTRSYFELDDDITEFLAELGQIHDGGFSDTDDYRIALELQKAIDYANNSHQSQTDLERITSLLANGQIESDELKTMARLYDTKAGVAESELIDSVRRVRIGELDVCFGFSPQILYMKRGLSALKGGIEADVYCVAYPSGSVIMDGGTNYDVVPICNRYDGGGRKGAGGFIVDREVIRDKDGFIVLIEREMRS